MSKITLAFGSFIVGLVVGSLLLGIHTVTFAQSNTPPPPRIPKVSDMNINSNGSGAPALGLGMQPKILGLAPFVARIGFMNGPQELDGLDCEDCSFQNSTLQYSGGAVHLVRPKFNGKIEVELKGPAANTLALLPFLTALAGGQKPKAPRPNKPTIQTISMKNEATAEDWATPFQ